MRVGWSALVVVCAVLFSGSARGAETTLPVEISGRYPHLAMTNHHGECGTGAVVPWGDRLWVITYSPHEPKGSDDKLYEISADLSRVIRPESVGGTPADRMIHHESDQLIIGPYFIDSKRNVRVVPPAQMPGRLTAVARHLTDPADKVYVYDMEGALFEVDVHTLQVHKLFTRVAPGAHGKGAYTGQGRLVVANNGNALVNKAKPAAEDDQYGKDPEAAGALAEWDGKTWHVIERREFTDVTGPAGIEGSPDNQSPLWAIGWDKRSVMLKLLDGGTWHTFRLPVADYSYVAKHGWYTEWPRIREVAPGRLLMNMHGQWFDFPKGFSAKATGGIRPIGDYQKITGDFCGWNGRIVFGCDDASILENPLLGQSQSNLWFTTWETLSDCGRPAGFGGPWVGDEVKADQPSEPYLFAGYSQRVVHLSHESEKPVTFKLELDADGSGKWTSYQSITVPPHGYLWHAFPAELSAEWVRVRTDSDAPGVNAYFQYGPGGGSKTDAEMFSALPSGSDRSPVTVGTLRPLGNDSGELYFGAKSVSAEGKGSEVKPVVLKPDLRFGGAADAPAEPKSKGAVAAYEVSSDEASLILTQAGHRFRLPVSDRNCDTTADGVPVRHIREVVTERFLVNAGGSFFVLPRPTAGGAMRLKPLATHNKRISDFCSWRGLTVMSGGLADSSPDTHYISAADHSAALWVGDVDDLWKMGKPIGSGGPWRGTAVQAGKPSDPYLMAGYDQKTLHLSHDATHSVHMSVEVDFLANNTWHTFHEFEVPPGKEISYSFPPGYSAHWVRIRPDSDCHATALLEYK